MVVLTLDKETARDQRHTDISHTESLRGCHPVDELFIRLPLVTSLNVVYLSPLYLRSIDGLQTETAYNDNPNSLCHVHI